MRGKGVAANFGLDRAGASVGVLSEETAVPAWTADVVVSGRVA